MFLLNCLFVEQREICLSGCVVCREPAWTVVIWHCFSRELVPSALPLLTLSAVVF